MANNYDYGQNFGKVKRLYPTMGTYPVPAKTFFQLKGGTTAMNPTDGYYYFSPSHNNYKAMLELLYLAADRQWTLYARTDPALDSNGNAQVLYLVVDF